MAYFRERLVSRVAKQRAKPNKDAITLARLAEFARSKERQTDRGLLLQVLEGGDVVPVGDAIGELEQWPRSQVELFRLQLQGFLRHLLEGSDDGGHMLPARTVNRIEFAPTMIRGRVLLTFDGPARDALWFKTIDLLRRVGLPNLRSCPGCGDAYVRNGRREYCSDKCQAKIYMRGRRERGQGI